jgi:hypothetical protein
MAYSDFKTVGSVKSAFGLTTIQDVQFLTNVVPVNPRSGLTTIARQILIASEHRLKLRNCM